MYSKALEVGIYPSEFWDMSVQEIRDTVSSRKRQKSEEIYTLSAMIRVAVLSVFPDTNVRFPDPPNSNDNQGNWQNSYNYLKALQRHQKEVQECQT